MVLGPLSHFDDYFGPETSTLTAFSYHCSKRDVRLAVLRCHVIKSRLPHAPHISTVLDCFEMVN